MGWRWWIVLAWAAAILLLFHHLGGVPLRDWDEALVARVAEEISLRPFPDNLLPSLWGEPYLNKPPLLHALVGLAISLWRHSASSEGIRQVPPEWLVRAIPALGSSLIVPLVALVQARLHPGDRLAALCTAAVAVTLLPLMRHGRLAMLDGSLISAIALQWWALLSLPPEPSASQQRHWGLIAGTAGSAILLLKAPAILPLLAGACLLLAWERRWALQQWMPLLLWIAIGLLPGLLWHGWHLLERGPDALTMWGQQGIARVVSSIEGHSGGWMVTVLEVLEGGWPWLALWPLAMLMALQQRRSRWGYWCLGLTLLTAAAVLPLRTQLPWYSHLLWPSFTVSVGPLLAQLIHRSKPANAFTNGLLLAVPWFWLLAGAALMAVHGQLGVPAAVSLPAALALLLGGSLLLTPQLHWRQWGAAAMVALLWVALFDLFASPFWLWELSEQWSVQPAVAWLKPLTTAGGQPPLLLQNDERPSLSWYLGQEINTGSRARRQLRDTKTALLVLSTNDPSSSQLTCHLIDQAAKTPQQGPDLYHCNPS